ncbi:tRNA (guanine(10)-n2)-methyltransferase [Anaeramoeba flamelloides]|uniref:tRNA (Guanine(10)-n2)-methyltransferase n=1 Tax=Anaeramoeba flamelloides TaxID=1746091 RepID=A0AAV7ZXM0_9EUKA|nr:tRNA (guanine(10)-n2)-methyltransferase [Anaeramoeba flamelloides]
MKYLFVFRWQLLDFVLPELRSLFKLYNLPRPELASETLAEPLATPFHYFDLNDEEAKSIDKICSRSVLIHSVYRVLEQGESLSELHENLKKLPYEVYQKDLYQKTFKFILYSFNYRWKSKSKYPMFDEIGKCLPHERLGLEVDLNKPDVELFVLFDYSKLGQSSKLVPRDKPRNVYLALQIGCTGFIDTKYGLKRRKFIGRTSMRADLSFLIANYALVKPGSLVYDPFCGTGSLLIPCSVHGAVSFASDIDWRTIKGDQELLDEKKKKETNQNKNKNKNQNENENQNQNQNQKKKGNKKKNQNKSNSKEIDQKRMRLNWEQYNIADKPLEIILMDLTNNNWNSRIKFDAIICDPPYGIREGSKQLGSKKTNQGQSKEIKGSLKYRIPSKKQVGVGELIQYLILFAAKFLNIGSRLCYWLPSRVGFKKENIPTHVCFKIIDVCQEKLSGGNMRNLIIMEKIIEFDPLNSSHLIIKDSNYSFKKKINEKGMSRKKLAYENRKKKMIQKIKKEKK